MDLETSLGKPAEALPASDPEETVWQGPLAAPGASLHPDPPETPRISRIVPR